jgi:16S rRNA (guanine527-N7)-methyltransferase
MPEDRVEFDRVLNRVVAQLEINLDGDQAGKLFQHYQLLRRWNERISLTSITRMEEVVLRHIGESLAVAKAIGPGTGAVVDIGSGAGFPGIPVAVYCPCREVTLVESVGKKAIFLKEAGRGMSNVRVFGGRFEGLEGEFEWGAWRAVAGASIREKLAASVRNGVMVLGTALAEDAGDKLGLLGVERHAIPWDARTVVMTGRIP